MADRIHARRGTKDKCDLLSYEIGYLTDDERLCINDGNKNTSFPNMKDIKDIKDTLGTASTQTIQNKQDIDELKEDVSGIIKTGVAKLVMYSYDVKLSEDTQKVNIPYERFDSATDTLKVYINGIAIPNEYYTITNPVENDGIITNGYIVLTESRPVDTIVRFEVWKNVPSGEEGAVSGSVIAENSIPSNRVIGFDQLSNPNLLLNGNFKINQRGQTSYNEKDKYTVDRWMLVNGGLDGAPHGSLSKRDNGISLTGAKSKQLYIEQKIDPTNFSTLCEKTLTLSCEMFGNNITQGNVFLQIYYNSDGKTITHKKIIDHTELKTNWNKYYITISTPANIKTMGVQVGTFNEPGNGYNFINEDGVLFINNVKLEIGDKPTAFYPRPYGEELALCQRYYISGNYNLMGLKTHFSSNILYYMIPLPVLMRSKPTLTDSSKVKIIKLNTEIDNHEKISPTNISVGDMRYNGVVISATLANHGITEPSCITLYDDTGYCSLDAEIY